MASVWFKINSKLPDSLKAGLSLSEIGSPGRISRPPTPERLPAFASSLAMYPSRLPGRLPRSDEQGRRREGTCGDFHGLRA